MRLEQRIAGARARLLALAAECSPVDAHGLVLRSAARWRACALSSSGIAPGCPRPGQDVSSSSRRAVTRAWNRVTLPGSELDHQPATSHDLLASRGGDLHLPVKDGDPRALMKLVIGEILSCRNLEHDRASIVAGREDLRRMRSKLESLDVPAVQRLAFGFGVPTPIERKLFIEGLTK